MSAGERVLLSVCWAVMAAAWFAQPEDTVTSAAGLLCLAASAVNLAIVLIRMVPGAGAKAP